jgi:hypothetical protein
MNRIAQMCMQRMSRVQAERPDSSSEIWPLSLTLPVPRPLRINLFWIMAAYISHRLFLGLFAYPFCPRTKIVLTYRCRGINMNLAPLAPVRVGGLWTWLRREPCVIHPADHAVKFVYYTCCLPGGAKVACREDFQAYHRSRAANCDLFPSLRVLLFSVGPHLGCRRYGL